MALMLIRVRNHPPESVYRTGFSRKQMCLWRAGYHAVQDKPSGMGHSMAFCSVDLRQRLDPLLEFIVVRRQLALLQRTGTRRHVSVRVRACPPWP
jgi:hypothetical protein